MTAKEKKNWIIFIITNFIVIFSILFIFFLTKTIKNYYKNNNIDIINNKEIFDSEDLKEVIYEYKKCFNDIYFLILVIVILLMVIFVRTFLLTN